MSKIDWRNWGVRAGALVLAVLLWLYAVTEHPYAKEIDARLYVEEPSSSGPGSGEPVVSNLLPARVRVLASGRGKDLLQLSSDDLLLRLRPDGEPGSDRVYRLSPSQVEVRTGSARIHVEEILDPKEVEVVIDHRIEREVPVRLHVQVGAAEAYTQVGPTEIAPRTVRISGPNRVVAQVEQVDTDTLVLVDVREDVDEPLAVRPAAHMRLDVYPAHVRVRADIQILAEDDIAQVPVRVRHARTRSVAPEPTRVQVKVRGGVDVIANLDPNRDLHLFVDYTDYSGEPLPVLSEPNPLFEIVEIVPPRVQLMTR